MATTYDLKNLGLGSGNYNIAVKSTALGHTTSNISNSINYEVVSYTISATCENCTAASSNPSSILAGGTATLVFTFDGTSYKCPSTAPSVTGATGSWTKDSDTQGTMVLSSPTGNVSFTVVGEEVASGYTITTLDYYNSYSSDFVTGYLKINADTVSSSDYDYRASGRTVYDKDGNVVSIVNLQNVEKVTTTLGCYIDDIWHSSGTVTLTENVSILKLVYHYTTG